MEPIMNTLTNKFTVNNWPKPTDWATNNDMGRLLVTIKQPKHFYVIAQHNYRKFSEYYEPFFNTYLYPGGNRLKNSPDDGHTTFSKAVQECKKHYNASKK